MKKTLMIIIIMSLLMLLNAETFYGRIIDKATLHGVADVNVSIKNSAKYLVTKEDGAFSITGLEAGKIVASFQHGGYETQVMEVMLPQDEMMVVQFVRKAHQLQGITITGTRAEDRKTPVAYSNIPQEQIRESRQGQDLPLILDEVPGLYAYSESGSGMGYSYMKMRGFDQNRIGVMINGVPLNDPEDHRVYWVDMPDFAESIQDIQFQRGVGTSKYGIASFGGSVNVETSSSADAVTARYDQAYFLAGSYNTRKYGVNYYSDLADNLKLNLRLSKITSDGYRDNSASELTSLYTSLNYSTTNSITDINFYTGRELTHAAWYASWEEDLAENHQHNPITYDNEIDDFEQPHFEIHNQWLLNDKMNFKNTLFYIKGKGYYEQLKEDADYYEYGINVSDTLFSGDIIRQKWVAKDQLGWVTNLSLDHYKGELSLGAYLSYFWSEHWGEVDELLSCPQPSDFESGMEYHRYEAEKQYITAYANENYALTDNINVMANLHYQLINYDFWQREAGNFSGEYLNEYSVDYGFFNPQLGINYNLNDDWNVFASSSIAHREPADNELYDIWDGPDDLGVTPLFNESEALYDENGEIKGYKWSDPQVEAEFVIDHEIGVGYNSDYTHLRLNAYYMDFQNEIVDYGGVDDEGYAVRGNSDATVHRGIEFDFANKLTNHWKIGASFAWSDNYFKDFVYSGWDGSEIDLSGNTLGGFPEFLGQAKLNYMGKRLNAFVQGQYSGEQYLDNTENDEHVIDDFTVFNLGFDYWFKNIAGNTSLAVELRLNNVFDLEYETAGYLDDGNGDWVYEDNFYFPASGRNISAGIRIMF